MWGKTTNPIQTTTNSTHNRTSQFPKGWYVCNGSNGTPNLSDKFIKGTTSLSSVGGTGGSHTKTLVTAYLPSHSHTLNNHTHTIDHNHASFTSGGSSAATTGSALTTHTHTIDHDHASFTSGIQSANHTHSIPAHNHAMTHGHTGSSESAGLHSHTITVKSNTVPHSHGISWITNVHSNESFRYGRHKHIVSDARRGCSDNANDRTMVELPNSNKPQDTDTYLDNWKSTESMKGLIQTSYATRRYTNDKKTSWSYLYTFNISAKNSSTQSSSYGDGRHNHDGQVYIQQTDIYNTTSYSYTNNTSTLKRGTLITHTNHKHDASSNDAGTHSHTITINNFTGNTSNSAALTSGSNSANHTHAIDVPNYTGSSGSANLTHTHTMAHTHSIDVPLFSGSSGAASGNTGSVGSGNAFDIQPAYYQVVFIMRIS